MTVSETLCCNFRGPLLAEMRNWRMATSRDRLGLTRPVATAGPYCRRPSSSARGKDSFGRPFVHAAGTAPRLRGYRCDRKCRREGA